MNPPADFRKSTEWVFVPAATQTKKTTFQTKFLDLHHKKCMANSKENVNFRSCVRNFSKRELELYLQMLQLVGKQIA